MLQIQSFYTDRILRLRSARSVRNSAQDACHFRDVLQSFRKQVVTNFSQQILRKPNPQST
jgi:hypothetical protein